MDERTFTPPDVRSESEIEFCLPSWQRKRKYVSWNHWFITKSASRKRRKDQKTPRFKLFEIAHYAGAVILEVGLQGQSNSAVSIQAASEAGWETQYFAIEANVDSIDRIHRKLLRKRIAERAVFFKGSLSEFRNSVPVVPTMVVVNERNNTEGILSHLALFLTKDTPVFLQNCFQGESDAPAWNVDSYENYGRFGDSLLLKAKTAGSNSSIGLDETEFDCLRSEFCSGSKRLTGNRGLQLNPGVRTIAKRSNKKWPFKKDSTEYPDTLPDGSAWPKISIVTPTYNQGQFIEETINSVIHQSYPNLEYIVVDGDSSDQTPEILVQYRDSIDCLISEPDSGQSQAINKGMAVATGEILTWLNSDDMLAPGTLFSMAMAFWKSRADMVVGTVQLLQNDEIVGEHLTSCPNGPLQLSDLLDLENNWLAGRFFYQPELMFTRDLWQRAGGFVDEDLYYSMDHELWLRFAIAGANLHVIGRPTVIYRVHADQKTNDDYRPELHSVNRRYIEKFGAPETAQQLQPRKYEVVFVNDVGVRYGAGIAHGRLRDSLVAAGHHASLVSAKADEASPAKTAEELYEEIESRKPDLVVFGNLHKASLDMGLVDRVSERWPSVFVMHDLWLATGRCFYSGGCEKFKSNCDSSCPTAGEYPAMNPEQIESAFRQKLNIISNPRKLVVMANSQWTQQVAESSAITSKAVLKTLKYGFPTHIFKHRDQSVCREVLGLPQDAFIVLFASVNVADERKGVRHLFEALNRLQLENLLPVCIGYSADVSDLYPGTISLGYVDDPYQNAMIYSAADVFVGPSLEEAFGQVFVEAAACGTPSVAYPVGGVSEAVVHGVTGRIANEVHPAALASEISRLYLDESYRQKLSVWGRIEVENEWSFRSAYHHFNNLLREVPEHIGFLPPAKISFDPAKTEGLVSGRGRQFGILEKTGSFIMHGAGFTEEEPLEMLDGSTRRIRWSVGNSSNLTVQVDGDGRQQVVAQCLNPLAEQTIDVFCNGTKVNSVCVQARRNFLDPIEICLLPELGPGEYQIRLEFSNTVKEQGGSRDLAMLFIDVNLNSLQLNKMAA